MPVTIAAGRELLADWTTLSAAAASSPPNAVNIAAFDPNRDVSAVGEVRLNGVWLRDLGIGTIVKDGADDAYIIVKDAKGPDYAALFFRDYKGAEVETGLTALTEKDGQITVAGFHEVDRSDADAVTADLMARGLAAGPPMLLLEPYFGDRTAALRSRQTFEAVTFAIIAGVNLIVFMIAFLKARAWRARVAARKPAASVPHVAVARTAAPQPFTSAPKAATPTRAATAPPPAKTPDPFAKGPIHSPKGWFR